MSNINFSAMRQTDHDFNVKHTQEDQKKIQQQSKTNRINLLNDAKGKLFNNRSEEEQKIFREIDKVKLEDKRDDLFTKKNKTKKDLQELRNTMKNLDNIYSQERETKKSETQE